MVKTIAPADLELGAERVLTIQGAPLPSAGSIYPMPWLDAPRALALLLTNPLLLARWPQRLAATAEAYAAGEYDALKVRSLAIWLLAQRDKLNLNTACEPDDCQGQVALLDLCDSQHLRDERAGLRRRVLLARPSEYAWLRALLEEAIVARSEAQYQQAA